MTKRKKTSEKGLPAEDLLGRQVRQDPSIMFGVTGINQPSEVGRPPIVDDPKYRRARSMIDAVASELEAQEEAGPLGTGSVNDEGKPSKRPRSNS